MTLMLHLGWNALCLAITISDSCCVAYWSAILYLHITAIGKSATCLAHVKHTSRYHLFIRGKRKLKTENHESYFFWKLTEYAECEKELLFCELMCQLSFPYLYNNVRVTESSTSSPRYLLQSDNWTECVGEPFLLLFIYIL